MVKLFNKLKQPLVVNIVGGEDVHFLSREKKEVSEEVYNSKEIQNYIKDKSLVVLSVE